MKKILAFAGLACALGVSQIALASEGNSTATEPPTVTAPPPPPPCTPAKRIYSRSNWRDAHPARGEQVCPSPRMRKLREAFRLWRRYRLVAPYRGYDEGDPYLKWLAVPRYITDCETRGYHGRGRWLASNGSAVGVYQLLGWGAPYPANTAEEKVRNHEIAAGLSLSNWACA